MDRRLVRDEPLFRDLRSPITDEDLRPLDPRCERVQFGSPLTDQEMVRVARFLEAYPDVALRIYEPFRYGPTLDFLRHFPFLKRFAMDAYTVQNWDGLRFLPDSLESLHLGPTRGRFSLVPIARFTSLQELSLDGHSKDIRVLSGLSALTSLTLRSITLPDLSLLTPLQSLRGLALKLGGTHHLDALRELPGLRYLELWRVRGLSHLSVLIQLPELRYLFLQDLTQVKSLPSFRPLRELVRCDIETLKGLSDLSPVADAPGLEELVLQNMRHLLVESLACFRDHPTLKRASVDLGSWRRNSQAATLLGRERVKEIKPTAKYVR